MAKPKERPERGTKPTHTQLKAELCTNKSNKYEKMFANVAGELRGLEAAASTVRKEAQICKRIDQRH